MTTIITIMANASNICATHDPSNRQKYTRVFDQYMNKLQGTFDHNMDKVMEHVYTWVCACVFCLR